MGKAGQFWWGLIIGIILGIFLLQFVVGFWIWQHHIFLFAISNRATFIGGMGLVAALILLGVAIGRMSKRLDRR
jgi:hypothetical protein